MKKTVLLFLLLCAAPLSFGQSGHLPAAWGNEYKPASKTSFRRVVALGGNTYVLRLRKEGGLFQRKTNAPLLEKFDQSNNLVFSKDIDVPLEGEKLFFGDFFTVKDQLLFTVLEEKEEGMLNVYAFEVNENGESLRKSAKLLRVKKLDDNSVAGVIMAPHRDKAIFYQLSFEDDQFLMKYATIAPGLKVSDAQTFKLAVKPGMKYQVKGLRFDGAENIRLLWQYSRMLDRKERKEMARADEVNPVYGELVTYNEKSGVKKTTKIEKYTSLLTYSVNLDEHNNLYLVGLPANTDNGTACHSVRLLKFDARGELVKEKEEKLPADILLKVDNAKKIEKNNGANLQYYKMRDVVLSEGGKGLAMAEYEFNFVLHSRNGSTYYYNYDKVMGFLFDTQTLALDKTFIIPKRQGTKNDGALFSGFYLTAREEKFYMAYNDSKKNLKKSFNEITAPAKIKKMNESVGIVLTISETGTVVERRVISVNKTGEIMIPDRTTVCGRETHLFAERRNSYTCRLGKVVL